MPKVKRCSNQFLSYFSKVNSWNLVLRKFVKVSELRFTLALVSWLYSHEIDITQCGNAAMWKKCDFCSYVILLRWCGIKLTRWGLIYSKLNFKENFVNFLSTYLFSFWIEVALRLLFERGKHFACFMKQFYPLLVQLWKCL